MFAFGFSRIKAVNLALIAGLALTAFAWGAGSALADTDAQSNVVGQIYTQSNAEATAEDATPNQVLVYNRASDGSLSYAGSYDTGGAGTGQPNGLGGLGSQGAVTLSRDGNLLFVVNGGSNTVTSFAVTRGGLNRQSIVSSGGGLPVSVTSFGRLVYVLNQGGSGSISGFTVSGNGALTPLSNSTRALSGAGSNAAQVQFSPDGKVLVVTEKGTNTIDTLAIAPDGRPGPLQMYTAAGKVPFGFDFTQAGILVVSEAASGSVSSYTVSKDGQVAVVSGAVPDQQAAACWLIVTQNGRYAYTANAASNSISSYTIAPGGSLTLLKYQAAAGLQHPTDMAFSVNSRFMYQLNTPNAPTPRSIAGSMIGADGSLAPVGTVTGLPQSAVGLAAR